ncbi:MAG TPA: glycosyltransferase [Candidatus Didemnitutus sp.]|jgi:hypothetical protein
MSPRARILIVTSGNLRRNPRPAKEAASLARAGYAVSVLYPSLGAAWDAEDAECAGAAGYAVCPLSTVGRPLARLVRRGTRWLAVRALALGWEDPAALGPGRQLARIARRMPADLTIAHNELGFWVARSLLSDGRRVIADFEDWYSEDLPSSERRTRPLRLLRRLEARMLHATVGATTTSAALRDALEARYGGRPAEVITNSFPLQANPRRRRPDEPVSCVWFSQTVGPGRGLETFLAAWSRLESAPVIAFYGEVRGGYADELRNRVPVTLRERLEFRGVVSASALPEALARHDVGLALEDASIPSRDRTITNKILQYLNAGLALVATPTAGQCEVLAAAPAAGAVFDEKRIPERGDWSELLLPGEKLSGAQRAARQAAEQKYCWELEEPRFQSIVARALESS